MNVLVQLCCWLYRVCAVTYSSPSLIWVGSLTELNSFMKDISSGSSALFGDKKNKNNKNKAFTVLLCQVQLGGAHAPSQ